MVDLYKNPTSPVDNWGAVLRPYDTDADLHRLGERAAHMVTVDSRNRNRFLFPNANNFRMKLKARYEGVYSVELLNAIIPIPQDGQGVSLVTERYVTLRSQELEMFEPAQGANPEQYPSPNLGNDPWYAANSDGGFAHIPLIPNFPRAYTGGNASDADTMQATFWKKSECRVIKRFFPFRSALEYLDIALVLRTNAGTVVPYPFADENTDPADPTNPEQNVILQFEIVAKT